VHLRRSRRIGFVGPEPASKLAGPPVALDARRARAPRGAVIPRGRRVVAVGRLLLAHDIPVAHHGAPLLAVVRSVHVVLGVAARQAPVHHGDTVGVS